MSRRVSLALYTSEEKLLGALHECRDHDLEVLDVYSPYPIHGIDDLMGIRRSRLPAACLIGGIVGLGLALWFQYWTSAVDWPIDVGGKPWNSLPAFAPVAFETTVLLAGLATVFGLLLRSGLIPGRAGAAPDLRVTDDRFALVVTRRDAAMTDAELAELWRRTGAIESRESVEEDR
jgi:ActD protein